MAKKVLLITSGQPSLNPRLVKEADALTDAGYHVTVLYAYWNNWGTELDTKLLTQKKWMAIRVGGDPVDKPLAFLKSRMLFKASRLIAEKSGYKIISKYVIARSSKALIEEAKKHNADLYIAHNLGALPAAVEAAKRRTKPCGFDAEDFHRHETSNNVADKDVILKSSIEDRYLPQVNYVTASSPQIAEAYQKIYPNLDPVIVLNVFPKTSNPITKPEQSGVIKLFWFSQTIGNNRGINDVVDALKTLPNEHFELHLLGDVPASSEQFVSLIKDSGINVQFHSTMEADKLTEFSQQFDVGLALEPAFTINNDIALSNKLFTYMQAGLAVIASDTKAQRAFMQANPDLGEVYPKGDYKSLAEILSRYYEDSGRLQLHKATSANLAADRYNWETESKKFLKVVETTISNFNDVSR